MLPDAITSELVNDTADRIDLGDHLEDRLADYLSTLADTLGEQLGLTEEQVEELEERLAWQVVLLPPQPAD